MTILSLKIEALGPFAGNLSLDFSPGTRAGLFLIHGPTGSGKTSILDALCYALYGASAGDERQARDLRSHHAGEDSQTSVCLEFALQEHRYRVKRWMSARKLATFTEKVVIEEIAPGQRIIADRRAEANQAIQDLLHLDAGQFRQVIVLPQGRFRDFLVASSQDRERILENLFATSRLEDFVQRLGMRRQLAQEELNRVHARSALLRESLGTDEGLAPEQVLENLDSQVREAATKRIALLGQVQESRTALAEASADQRQFQALRQAEQDCVALEAEQASRTEQEKHLSMARAANAIRHFHEETTTLRQTVSDMVALKQRLDADLTRSAAELITLTDQRDQTAARHASIPERQELLARRQAMLGALEVRDRLAGQIADEQTRASRDEARLAELENACRSLGERLQSGQAERQSELSLAQSSGMLDSLLALLDRLQESWQNRVELEEQTLRLGQEARNLGAESTHLAAMEAELRASLAHQDQLQVHSQAFQFARDLQEGQACPVCGSLHHPAPAQPVESTVFPVGTADPDRQLQELNERRNALTVSQRLNQSNAVRASEGISQTNAQLSSLCQELQARALSAVGADTGVGSDGADFPTDGSISCPSPEIRQCLDLLSVLATPEKNGNPVWAALTSARERVLQLSRKSQAASRSILQMDRQLAALSEKSAELDRERQKAREQVAVAGERLANLRERLAEETKRLADSWNRSGEGLPDRNLVELQISADREWLERTEKEFRQSEAALVTSSQHQAVLAGRLQDLDQRIISNSAQLDEREKRWQDAVVQAGFTDQSAALARILPPSRLEALEAALESYRNALLAARSRRSELQGLLTGKTESDLSGLASAVQESESALADAERELAGLEHRHRQAIGLVDDLTRNELELAERTKSLDSLAGLHRLVSGQEAAGGYVNLQRYALSVFLDEILLIGNQHLHEMSRGRYRLVREDQVTGKKRTGGLELYVADTLTGIRRGTESLSGGESFITALSLALGLSAVVHSRSGGVRLDTLFVDEGFGSLDGESLEDAMQVLGRIHERGRVIGIISHVRELQERIITRLVVYKGPAGSSAAWAV